MINDEFSSDHDILVTIVAEVRQIKQDIKELRDGTSRRLDSVENRVEKIEMWQAERRSQILSDKAYLKFIIGLGILILGIIIYHLTGFRI